MRIHDRRLLPILCFIGLEIKFLYFRRFFAQAGGALGGAECKGMSRAGWKFHVVFSAESQLETLVSVTRVSVIEARLSSS